MCVFIMMAIFTTSGTFMLIFLAALQGVDDSVYEAAALDGATEWTKFRYVTVPMIRPAIFTVVTLGLIGTWQVFDQIYVGTKGTPAEHDAHAGIPVLQLVLQQQRMGRRRGDRIHPLRDHRPLYDPHTAYDAELRPRAATPSLRADAAARDPRRFARCVGGRQAMSGSAATEVARGCEAMRARCAGAAWPLA